MRKLIGALCLLSLTCSAQFVSLRNFDTNYFQTNTIPVPANQWLISINTNNSIFGGGGSELWTNDTVGLATVIRPVDKARAIWHDQVTSNYFGMIVQNLNTNGDTFTVGGNFADLSTNYGTAAIYYQDGAFGGVFESAGAAGALKAGSSIGALGISDGSARHQYGLAGTSVGQFNNQTNVGVAGSALSNGKTGNIRVGGYFQTLTNTAAAAAEPAFHESSAIIANSGNTGDWSIIGQTNGTPTYKIRADGSIYIGKHTDQDTDHTDFSEINFWIRPMVLSNEVNHVFFSIGAIDSPSYNYASYADINATASPNRPLMDFFLGAQGTNTSSWLNINLDPSIPGNSYIRLRKDFNEIWRINADDGDMITLKGVTYSWPSGYGGAQSVLTMPAADGTLVWSNITALVTNNQARIGPGTTNWVAKFLNPTNVMDSSILNYRSNIVELRQALVGSNYISNTNMILNLYGYSTNADATNMYLQISSGSPFGNDHADITTVINGMVSQRPPIRINNSWIFEPNTNFLSGHAAGLLYPTPDNANSIGSSSSRVFGMTIGTGNLDMGLAASKPNIRIGAGLAGIHGDADSLGFWRPTTGITAAFCKDELSGGLNFDIAGNYLAFGNGLSNTVSYLSVGDQVVAQLGIIGMVQVGTNNPTVTTPGAVGFVGGPGTGSNKGGSSFVIHAGPSSGNARGGDFMIATARPGSSGSSINTFTTNFFVAANPVTLTESSPTGVFTVAVQNGKVLGLTVTATTEALDATDNQVVTETFSVAASSKAGVVTSSVSASAPMATLATSGTLTTAWTATDGTGTVVVRCNATSSLTQTTLRVLGYQIVVHTDGTGVIVPQ